MMSLQQALSTKEGFHSTIKSVSIKGKYSLDKFKPSKDTTGWNDRNPILTYAHHKLPKSALVWLFEHMSPKMKILYNEAFNERETLLDSKTLLFNQDELHKKLAAVAAEQERREALSQKEREALEGGGMFLTRLRSNLIAPNQQGTEVHTIVADKDKVSSGMRDDDPHNNREFGNHEEIEGLEVVRYEDETLTPRSEVYLELAAKQFEYIYQDYKNYIQLEKEKINLKLPENEIEDFMHVLEMKGEIRLGEQKISLDWIKKYTDSSYHDLIKNSYNEISEKYAKEHQVEESIGRLFKNIFDDKLKNVTVISGKNLKKANAKAKKDANNKTKDDPAVKDVGDVKIQDSIPILTEKEILIVTSYITQSGKQKYEDKPINEDLLLYCTDKKDHEKLKLFFNDIRQKEIGYGKLVVKIQQKNVDAKENEVKKAAILPKQGTQYTEIINKIKAIKLAYKVKDDTAATILEMLLKAEQLHEDIESSIPSGFKLDEAELAIIGEKDEQDKALRKAKAKFPSNSGGLFAKNKREKFAKMPAKKILTINEK